MPAPNWTRSDFLAAFIRCLPRGRAWPAGDAGESVQGQALATLMPTYERQTARANYLLVDSFPATTDELLPEWQYTLGLPDPCAGPAPTLEQQQAQVVARFTGRGGQSIAYFVNFAASLGYQITITQFAPSRFGQPFGLPMNGEAWAYAWRVNAPSITTRAFAFGNAGFGEPFTTWGNLVLECELQRLKPAHTTLMFSYS